MHDIEEGTQTFMLFPLTTSAALSSVTDPYKYLRDILVPRIREIIY